MIHVYLLANDTPMMAVEHVYMHARMHAHTHARTRTHTHTETDRVTHRHTQTDRQIDAGTRIVRLFLPTHTCLWK